MQYSEEFSERIEACRELYLKYGGKNHELIEQEMRELGYRDFHRRNLYRRFERGTCKPGWIETYGWDYILRNSDCGIRNEEKEETGANATVKECAVSHEQDSHYTNPQSAFRIPQSNDFEEFKNWLKQTWSGMTWEWKHQVYIYKRLRRVWDGKCKRLMIFMPPRHGKSELVTVRFPAWCLKQDPAMNIIIGSYNQKLANRFSRKIRNALADDAFLSGAVEEKGSGGVARSGGVKEKRSRGEKHDTPPLLHSSTPSLPYSFSPSRRSKNTEAEWETEQGGGVKAVGVGAGVTGYGAQLIIIDDPVKSRAEAESETFRERVWDWFNDDLYTRLEPDGRIILIQTRWHEDDLAGRLLREAAEEGGEQWEVISLPAVAEVHNAECTMHNEEKAVVNNDDSEHSDLDCALNTVHCALTTDPLGRAPGEALCPERFNEEKLDRIRRKLGSYSFAALYQQTPIPAEGGLFKRAWFRIVNTAPPNLRWKRGYDLAISKNANSDYTASLRVAYDRDGSMYIDGGFRRRIEYPEQRRYILGRIQNEPDTEHGIELSANGNAVVQDLRREPRTRGRPLRGVRVKGDKVTRALPWIALAEEGKVFLVRGAWTTEFIDEAASFPSGTHDDQIDAVSIAVRMHREQRGRLYTF